MRPEDPDQVFGPPWYRDPDKLLQAVLDRAGDDPAFAARVIEQIGSWAAKDMRHRDALREFLKASKPGRQRVPYWRHVLLLNSYNAMRSIHGMTHSEALTWLAEVHLKLSESTAEDRLTAARKAVQPHHVVAFTTPSDTP